MHIWTQEKVGKVAMAVWLLTVQSKFVEGRFHLDALKRKFATADFLTPMQSSPSVWKKVKCDKGVEDNFAHINWGHCFTFEVNQEYIVGWFLAQDDVGQCSNCKIYKVQGFDSSTQT